ncbi:hypothetical protein CMI37_13240 [Candidatus Pacearchaeota archaeon]|nr:hypothetical protein [Candidatus Pacearchaeota archaeon]
MPDREFIEGLNLIINSLIQKQEGLVGPDVVSVDKTDDIEKNHHEEDGTGKTNLPPEMGKREEGESIAEPLLRRRQIRKAELEGLARGIDLFKMWADVDRTLEKTLDSPSAPISDVDVLGAFRLPLNTPTTAFKNGTLVHKVLSDRRSRPSKEWWNSCLEFAKGVSGISEPAFFTSFLYYEPTVFDPELFMKGLNDTGATPATTRRGVSHDTEIDENIGAMGGQAIDGLGMSDDSHEHDIGKG